MDRLVTAFVIEMYKNVLTPKEYGLREELMSLPKGKLNDPSFER